MPDDGEFEAYADWCDREDRPVGDPATDMVWQAHCRDLNRRSDAEWAAWAASTED